MAASNERRWNGGRRGIATAAAVLCCVAGARMAAAQVIPKNATSYAKTVAGENPYNEGLLRLTPEERAQRLAGLVGPTCIGTKPFFMGITKEGRARGYAYWSLECAGASSFMIQVAPDGEAAAIDCKTFKQNGEGRECYKTF